MRNAAFDAVFNHGWYINLRVLHVVFYQYSDIKEVLLRSYFNALSLRPQYC